MEHCVFTVLLPVVPHRRVALESFLRSGSADSLFGFSAVESLHFASMTIHDDPRSGSKLILELNGDGRALALLRRLVTTCGPRLHPVLDACQGWSDSNAEATVGFLRANVHWPSARHVGNTGRTVDRIRAEADFHVQLESALDALQDTGATFASATDARTRLRREVDPEQTLPPVGPRLTRGDWVVRLIAPACLLLVVPVAFVLTVAIAGWRAALLSLGAALLALLLGAAAGAATLRHKETRDPASTKRPSSAHIGRLEAFEDVGGVQNHLASIVAVKPGPFRRWLLRLVLFVVGLAARLLATHGRLGKLSSIHFAHWSIIDGGRNLLFLSNFDGSWESYLDDFIEKAHTGLTAVWSNGVGFPRTHWLVNDGASDGEAFKAWARLHQLPSLSWYQAYPNRSVQQIDQASLLREGLHGPLSIEEERAWARAI